MIRQQAINEFINTEPSSNSSILMKDNSLPKISIVTPSFNQDKYLKKTIFSVLNQNYPNLEYIIIDGGSDDNSVKIIKEYQKYLTYWISENDRGQAHAINKGLKRSKGDIIAWLNSDDIYLPGTLHNIANNYKKNNESNFFYGHCVLINKDDIIIDYLYTCNLDYAMYVSGANLFQGSVFWKRSLHDKYGGVDESMQYAMEYELFDKFFKYEKGSYVNKALAGFRIHDESKGSIIGYVGKEELYKLRGTVYKHKSTILFLRIKRYFQMLIDGNIHKKIAAIFILKIKKIIDDSTLKTTV